MKDGEEENGLGLMSVIAVPRRLQILQRNGISNFSCFCPLNAGMRVLSMQKFYH